MRQFFLTALSLLFAQGLLADGKSPMRFELLHIWAVDKEQYALDAFRQPLLESGVEWSEHIVETNFEGIRKEYSNRLALDVPPTASSWIGSGDSIQTLVEADIFRAIRNDDVHVDFEARLIPEVYEAIKREDGINQLPLGIHLQNVIVYNQDILEELGREPPRDWREFVKIAREAKSQGYIPLSVSDQTWQFRFLVTSILASYLSVEDFQTVFDGTMDRETIRNALTETFLILKELRSLTNDDYQDLPWKSAVQKVTNGDALAHVSGDFIAPYFGDEDKFVCHITPGTNYLLWSFDTIVLTETNDPAEIEGQNKFVEIVATPNYYAQYIERKGGVPVFRNIDASNFDSCSQNSQEAWKNADARLLMTSNAWYRDLTVISNISKTYWSNPDMLIPYSVAEILVTLETIRN